MHIAGTSCGSFIIWQMIPLLISSDSSLIVLDGVCGHSHNLLTSHKVTL